MVVRSNRDFPVSLSLDVVIMPSRSWGKMRKMGGRVVNIYIFFSLSTSPPLRFFLGSRVLLSSSSSFRYHRPHLHLDSSSSRPINFRLQLLPWFPSSPPPFPFFLAFPILSRTGVDSRLLSGSLLGGDLPFPGSPVSLGTVINPRHSALSAYPVPLTLLLSPSSSSSSSSFEFLSSSASKGRSQRETPLRPSHTSTQTKIIHIRRFIEILVVKNYRSSNPMVQFWCDLAL